MDPEHPDILAIRQKFRLEKENKAKAEEASRVKFYYFGSRGKRSCIPTKLLEIKGFIDWIERDKIEILDKILYKNDIENLLYEFNNIQ
jgi:hypothetical protein